MNSAPVAIVDTYTDLHGQILAAWPGNPTPGLLDNDTDADNDALTIRARPRGVRVPVRSAHGPPSLPRATITKVNGAAANVDSWLTLAGGTLWVSSSGNFTFNAFASFAGQQQFTYEASDGAAGSTAVVTIDITNTPPVAVDDQLTGEGGAPFVTEDTPITFGTAFLIYNDSDADGDTLTLVSFGAPSSGVVVDNGDGTATYYPDPNFNGPVTVAYTISDPPGATATAQLSFEVASVNDAPEAFDDLFSDPVTTLLDTTFSGNVLANDSDDHYGAPNENNTPLTAQLVAGPVDALAFSLAPDGSFVWQGPADYMGMDSFTYVAVDSLGAASAPATVYLIVGLVPLGDYYSVDANGMIAADQGSVLDNDWWPPSVTVTPILDAGPAHGSLTLHADGTFDYQPDPDFVGEDLFSYKLTDGTRVSAAAQVVIDVQDEAGYAGDASFSVLHDRPLTVDAPGLVFYASDPDDFTTTVELVDAPQHGSVVLNPDGSFQYDPEPGYVGADFFTYQAKGKSLASAPGTVSLDVTNTAPEASEDENFVYEPSGLSSAPSVLDNDFDEDGDALTAVLAAGPLHAASFTLNDDGTFLYQPEAGFIGEDEFYYQASDGPTLSAPTRVLLKVSDAGIAQDDFYYLPEDGSALTVGALDGVLTNDYFSPGAEAYLVTPPEVGALTLNTDGSFSFAYTLVPIEQDGQVVDYGFQKGDTVWGSIANGINLTFDYLLQKDGQQFGKATANLLVRSVQEIMNGFYKYNINPTATLTEVEFVNAVTMKTDTGAQLGNKWTPLEADPVAYSQGSSIQMNAWIKLQAAKAEYNNWLPSLFGKKVSVRAEIDPVNLPSNPMNPIVNGDGQLQKKADGYYYVSVTGLATTGAALPFTSIFSDFATRWSVFFSGQYFKPKPGIQAGASHNRLYSTFSKPPQGQVYQTLLNIGTPGPFSANTRDDAITTIWNKFATPADAPLRLLNNKLITYYMAEGKNLAQDTPTLLKTARGNCIAFSKLFVDVLRNQGIDVPKNAVTGLSPQNKDELLFVNSWEVSKIAPSSKALYQNDPMNMKFVAAYSYVNQLRTLTLAIDSRAQDWGLRDLVMKGVGQTPPGQNNPLPPQIFRNHVVVALQGKLFDPSYGIIYDDMGDFSARAIGYFGRLGFRTNNITPLFARANMTEALKVETINY